MKILFKIFKLLIKILAIIFIFLIIYLFLPKISFHKTIKKITRPLHFQPAYKSQVSHAMGCSELGCDAGAGSDNTGEGVEEETEVGIPAKAETTRLELSLVTVFSHFFTIQFHKKMSPVPLHVIKINAAGRR